LSDTTIAQPIASPSQTTTYYLLAELAGGCEKLDSVTVTVVDIDAGNDTTICEGDKVNLGEMDALKGVQYGWSPSSPILTSPASAQAVALPPASTSYELIAFANGCLLRDTVNINVIENTWPNAHAGQDVEICKGDSITIGTTANLAYTYNWKPTEGLSDPFSATPIAFGNQSINYLLEVNFMQQGQCTHSSFDSVLVFIDPCLEVLHIPNIITPNGDGSNDAFFIEDLPLQTELVVFNRWGKPVYLSASYDNTWGASKEEDGVYFYVITLISGEKYKGFVQVVR
jgi:gliding motility-associated-like protein